MRKTIIIGGGIAGITAAIYAQRYRLDPLLLCEELGGTLTKIHKIENYPGFSSISGIELTQKFKEQLDFLKVEHKTGVTVKKVEKTEQGFLISFGEKEKIETQTIIIGVGASRRKLGVPGEKEFVGKGVSYCYTCDAPFFKDKKVGVVGGSDSAVMAAQLLAQYAKEVYIIYRKDKLRAEPYNVEQIERDPKVKYLFNTNIAEIKGDAVLKSVVFDNGKEFELDGLFIEIGMVPVTALASQIGIKLNEKGYIEVDNEMKTNVPGVFAAGDICTNVMKQLIIAAAEGAIAANSAFEYGKEKTQKQTEKN